LTIAFHLCNIVVGGKVAFLQQFNFFPMREGPAMRTRLLACSVAGLALMLLGAGTTSGQQFVDVAPQLGLNFTGACGGAFWFDYDGDNDLDLLRTERFSGEDVIFRNDGDHFTLLDNIGLSSNVDHGTTLPMDFDHDGDYDIWIDGYGTTIQLMVNENGTFVDRTAQLGLDPQTGGRHGTWLDVNHDGWMDLMIEFIDGWKLYRNDQGEFTDITSSTQLPNLFDGSFFSETDIDLDGDIDLFMTRIGGSDHLYVNQGTGTFVDGTGAAGLSGVPAELGCLWADFDNDKYPDLLTQGSNYHAVWHNNGDGTFREMNVHGTETDFQAGDWPYGARYAAADFDMDRDIDFYVCRPGGCAGGLATNQFFRMDSIQNLDIWFTDIAPELGMDFAEDGYPWVADFDQDGDMDLYIAQHNSPDRLFRNDMVHVSSWLEVEVLGPMGERDRWHTRAEIYPHGAGNLLGVSELNFSNVGRNGFSNYLVVDANAHYDLRLYFACGVSMLPTDYPSLSNIVPAEVNHLMTVYMGQGAVAASDPPEISRDLTLENAYPNPFNAVTSISFQVAEPSNVRLSVYAVDGRWVTDLVNGTMTVGKHQVTWDARDATSGIYFLRLSAGNHRAMSKVVLLK
jgi:hypothetical protein